MNKCIICSKEIDNYICDNCKNQDLEQLCQKIIDDYKLNLDSEEFYNNPKDRDLLENIIKDLTKDIDTPKKEYFIIQTLFNNDYSVKKDGRDFLIDNYNIIINDDKVSKNDKNIIYALLLDAYYKNYNYIEAEKISNILEDEEIEDEKILYNLGDYYMITRRYDMAIKHLNKGCSDNIKSKIEECMAREKGKEAGGKAAYLPAKKEYKEIYMDFINSLGIDIEMPIQRKKAPEKIKIEDYPKPVECQIPGFNSFVAFDVETTGLSSKTDSIIEIAAIKVRDGKIIESFQELVHPYKKKIPVEVEMLTGITNNMVYNRREIWEVFEDFVKFIGDDILVGYNCMTFDSQFLVRAGRLSNIKIYNQYFDVMKYVIKSKDVLNYTEKNLVEVANLLGIENPNAHRALADAITTAKVYLKLLELNKGVVYEGIRN